MRHAMRNAMWSCLHGSLYAAGLAAALVVACRPVVMVDPPAPVGASPRTGDTTPPTSTSSVEGSAGAAAAPASVTRRGEPAPRGTSAVRAVAPLEAPAVAREFRGVWVASVANIDWPSKRTLTTEAQQQELIALLDRAAELKLNAVVFQVRPAADALYASTIEPWSEYLTGTQGRAPDPYWDPLAFAIREAHARHLELHAWFNPYRARFTDAKSALSSTHIARTNPSLVKAYGGYLWMDPGERLVRARTLEVVLDVVKRYDIDGVHIDDYFYPYPESTKRGREIPFPDEPSWQRYRKGGGTLARDDWRRQNVDLLVQALHEGIHQVKPWVRFGVSPFGIWRPGYPAQVRGFDAYQKLYADARKWLHEGWVDYFTPQLYWPTTKVAQAYPALLQWWVEENTQARHLWPGNFSSRAGASGGSAFPVSELVEQIRVTREQPGATGNVHFSMKSFLQNQAGMNDALKEGPYASLALVPATPWLRAIAPPVPAITVTSRRSGTSLALGTVGKTAAPWQWLVQVRTADGWTSRVLAGTQTTMSLAMEPAPTQVTVRALNRVGVESEPATLLLEAAKSGSRTRPLPAPTVLPRGRPDGR